MVLLLLLACLAACLLVLLAGSSLDLRQFLGVWYQLDTIHMRVQEGFIG